MCFVKDKTKGKSIVEFVNLPFKMFSFTVCDVSEFISRVNYLMDVRQKAVAQSVTRF